jgi:PAS domain S-box-containing protein
MEASARPLQRVRSNAFARARELRGSSNGAGSFDVSAVAGNSCRWEKERIDVFSNGLVQEETDVNSMPVELSLTGLVEVLDSLREGIQILDQDFRYIYVNRAVSLHGQLSKQELVGKTMSECYPGIEHTETFGFLDTCMKTRQPASKRNEFEFPDGTRGVFELRVQPCSAGIVVLSIDITEQTRLEAHLLQSQKLDALGRLAGGVAHDFNNLLSVILSHGELVLEELPQESHLRSDIQPIVDAAGKAAHLTKQLLSFSRHEVKRVLGHDLNRTLRISEPILRRLAGPEVALSIHPDAELALVDVEASQVDQILLNLVVNARDAMPEGGRLVIETSNIVLDDAAAAHSLGLSPGPYVQLVVSDTGVGMSPELQMRIFEPFFTTKEGRGTGLGLSIVFGVVQRARGAVWLYSELDKGTTFRVYLPRSQAGLVPRTIDEEPLNLAGTETILVVDDDDGVRGAAVRVLEKHGYRVLAADGVDSALELWATNFPTIQLLITDIVMPPRSGTELARALRRDNPALPVLFMSGYAERAVDESSLLGPDTPYLAKPIVPRALSAKVRQVLDQAAEARAAPPV